MVRFSVHLEGPRASQASEQDRQASEPGSQASEARTDGRTEDLHILQDFFPYWGRCPATAQLQLKNYIKQGKGTADHMMPLGDWFGFITFKRYIR